MFGFTSYLTVVYAIYAPLLTWFIFNPNMEIGLHPL